MPSTNRRSRPLFRLESIAFAVAPRTKRSDSAARRVVADVLGPKAWRVSALSVGKGEFEAIPRRPPRPASGRGLSLIWQRVHQLRADPRVLWADPLFETLSVEKDLSKGRKDQRTD